MIVTNVKQYQNDVICVDGYVPSDSRPIYHHVMIWIRDKKLIRWTCTCEWHVYKGHISPCKHVLKLYWHVLRMLG